MLDQLVEEGVTGQPDYRNEPFIWASLSSDSINLKALKEQGKTKQYLSEVTGVAFEYDPTFHSYVSTNLETLSLDAQNLGRGVIKELKDKNIVTMVSEGKPTHNAPVRIAISAFDLDRAKLSEFHVNVFSPNPNTTHGMQSASPNTAVPAVEKAV